MLNENNTLLKENEEVEKTLENASYKLSFGYLEKAEKRILL